jgi:WD40 repeat protein
MCKIAKENCIIHVLAVVVIILITACPALAEERLALLIGNYKYSDKVGPLTNPGKDVAIIRDALLKIGFKAPNITVVENADLKTLHLEIGKFQQKVRAAGEIALGFFYYSGHGAANRSVAADGLAVNYILPVDVSDEGNDALFSTSVKLNEIVNDIRTSAPLADLIVIFDACRSELRVAVRSPTAKTFIAENIPLEGNALLAFSTEPNQLASDVGTNGGPFATALAKELLSNGANEEEIFFNVKLAVWEATHHQQKPWYLNQFLKRLYLLKQSDELTAWTTAESLNTAAAYENFRTQFPNSQHALQANAKIQALSEAVDWQAIGNAPNLTDLEAFLRKYPSGAFSPEATDKLAVLRRAEDDRDWTTAKQAGTVDAIIQYLRKHPFQDHYAEALDALAELKKTTQGSVDKSADMLAWQTAEVSNRLDAYESYIHKFTNGAYASQAQQKIASLKESSAWDTVASSNSKRDYDFFLNSYPDGPHSAVARENLRRLVAVDQSNWQKARSADTVEAYKQYLSDSREKGAHLQEAAARISTLQKEQTPSSTPEHSAAAEVSNLFFPKAPFQIFEKGNLAALIDLKSAKPVRRLILSNDLSRLFTGGDDGSLRLWDLNNIKHSVILEPRHGDKIYALARSVNSRLLATGSWDKSVWLWDTRTNQRVAQIPVRPKVFSMSFSPTGRWIAAAGTDGQVDFISTARLKVVKQRQTNAGARVHAIAYVPDKDEDLIVGDATGSLRLWSIVPGRVKTISNAHRGEILVLAVDPTGTSVASAGVDRTIKIWDTKLNLSMEIPNAHERYITSIRFTPDHKYLASGGGDHVIKFWDTQTGRRAFGPLSGHKEDVEEIDFSPDGKYMFTSSEDKTIKIWDLSAKKVLYTFVAFADGNYVVYDAEQRFLSSENIDTILSAQKAKQ